MKLPNLSNSMAVAEWRYVQWLHEPPELRNPDGFVGHFLAWSRRLHCRWPGRQQLAALRSQPFYYYLVARTRYYDELFAAAVTSGVATIINVGCGSDTRSYRFAKALCKGSVRVLECDQPAAIDAKRRLVKARGGAEHVAFIALDLNDGHWPEFSAWLQAEAGGRTWVLMEGVSPYIETESFERFLALLAAHLPNGSRLAYDFKIAGAADDFGRSGRTVRPFRLNLAPDDLAARHAALGYAIEHQETSTALTARLLPSLAPLGAPVFAEDGLLQLRVERR